MLGELDRIREAPVDRRPSCARLATSSSACSRSGSRRPGPSAGRSAGLFVHDLPGRRARRATASAIEAVTVEDVQRVARDHVHPEAAAIVLVGDNEQFAEPLAAAGLGPMTVIEDEAQG